MFQMKKLRRSFVSLMLVFVLMLSQTAVFAEIDLIKRSEAADQYKWYLTDIYADEAAFMADIEMVEAALPKLETYSGQLTTVDKIAELFAMEEEVSRKFWTAYVYANLMIDLDQRNDKATEYVSIVSTLYGQ